MWYADAPAAGAHAKARGFEESGTRVGGGEASVVGDLGTGLTSGAVAPVPRPGPVRRSSERVGASPRADVASGAVSFRFGAGAAVARASGTLLGSVFFVFPPTLGESARTSVVMGGLVVVGRSVVGAVSDDPSSVATATPTASAARIADARATKRRRFRGCRVVVRAADPADAACARRRSAAVSASGVADQPTFARYETGATRPTAGRAFPGEGVPPTSASRSRARVPRSGSTRTSSGLTSSPCRTWASAVRSVDTCHLSALRRER